MAIKLLMPADKNKAMLKEGVSTCFPRCLYGPVEPIVVRVCVCVCVCVCVGGGGKRGGGQNNLHVTLRYDTRTFFVQGISISQLRYHTI